MKLFILAAALLGMRAHASQAPSKPGILLLAHGGDEAWNLQVERLRAQVDAAAPAELALGMADPATLQSAIERLQKRRVSRIVAVPLFVNSRSEVMDQMRYVLGLSAKPSQTLRAAQEAMKSLPPGHHHMHMFSLERAHASVPVTMSAALDGDDFVSRVLLARARALSRDAARENVILVAHGPVDESALASWEKSLVKHARAVRAGGGFHAVSYAVLRDDAAPAVRAAAVALMRGQVQAASGAGLRALVVPVLIARGGIEDKIARDLRGLEFAWSGEALLPQEGFDAWVLSRAGIGPTN